MSLTSAARALLVAAIAWGVFAFGAVYSWAYWPLAAAVLTVALGGLLAPGSVGWRQLNLTSLSIAFTFLLAACAVQVVPLPWKWVGAISPQAPEVIAELDVGARLGLTTAHPLSIDPARSLRGLIVVGSLALLVVGATRLFSITGVVGVAMAIAAIGSLLALTGIIQRPLYTGKIYGFWSPLQSGASPFGPFVNRNHFAGWMLMGLPLTIGLLGSCIARDNRKIGPDLRDRILWLSSPSASAQMLLLGAVGLMALSLILTTSRSGISAAALAVATVLLSFRRRLSPRKGVVAVTAVSTVIVLVIAWAGTSAVASRFTSGRTNDFNARMGVWKDTARIAALYPFAGTGLNTFPVATVFYQELNPAQRYLQAHNDYLQLAAEGGLLLGVPAAICVALFAWGVRRRFAEDTSRTGYWIRTGAVIGLLAIALQETVDFSLQMPGNAVMFAVLCAIALHKGRRPAEAATRRLSPWRPPPRG
jgi:O-antigen ligase